MDYNVFTDGIEPGGLRNKEDIGILICFMLRSSKQEISNTPAIKTTV